MGKRQDRWFKKQRTWSCNRLIHFMRRAKERHNLDISAFDYNDMIEQVKNGSAEQVNKSIYGVSCQCKKVYIVTSLCKGKISLKTMLPENFEVYKEKGEENE